MSKKHILVSFDYEKDLHYKNLLSAWDKNPDFDFFFQDKTPSEIDTNNISVVKQNLTKKIQDSTGVLVIVGKDCNKKHKDSALIGYNNWQVFEIEKAKALGKKLIAVKLDSQNTSPSEMLNCGFTWAMSFSLSSISTAIKDAYAK